MMLGALSARPLAPTWFAGTIVSGHEDPLGAVAVPNPGWPAPLLRFASFAVLPRPQVRVNVVTGVTAVPGNARRRS